MTPTTWRAAFLEQARHDYQQYQKWNLDGGTFCDQLHYLQMASEKLSRGYFANPASAEPPEFSHAGIVKMLQHLKGDITIRLALGYKSSRQFSLFLDSLLDTAMKIQSLAPAISGTTAANPEYPWRDRGSQEVTVPCQYEFPQLNEFRNARASKFLKLMDRLFMVVIP